MIWNGTFTSLGPVRMPLVARLVRSDENVAREVTIVVTEERLSVEDYFGSVH